MKRACLFMLAISLYGSELRVSEVMSNPQGSEYENEFIEVYNPNSDVIQINGWVLSDGKGQDSIMHMAGPELIPPGGYALILDPGYDLQAGIYMGLIPENTPIFSISTDATFGSGGLSNSGESVLIHDPDSIYVSFMSWDRSTGNGYSWERVDLNSPDEIALWEESEVENGTPGYENSVVRAAVDLVLTGMDLEYVEATKELRISSLLKNQGSDTISAPELSTKLRQAEEVIRTIRRSLPDVHPGDSLLWVEILRPEVCGWTTLVQEVDAQGDEDPSDNMRERDIYLPCEQTPLILNEIMPLPYAGEPEWIEVFNRSDRAIDLSAWSVSDNSEKQNLIIDSTSYLFPGEYLLVTDGPQVSGAHWAAVQVEMEGFPSLNNSTDAVVLYDPTGHVMDRVNYYEDTGLVEGRSLERVRIYAEVGSANWRISVAESGSTPGGKNSLYLKELAPAIEVLISPKPFYAGKEKELNIALVLPVDQAAVSIQVFDLAGREIAVPVPLQVVAHRSRLKWDGMASYGAIATTGLYICRIIIDDMSGQINEYFEKVYLIND